MTWLWRIFFSALSFTPLFAASVTGKVELVDSRDPGVRKHDYSGVVVWLEPVGSGSSAAASRPHPASARMIQKGKRFIPHVLAIPVGASVDFPNFDPIFHNAFSNFSGQVFDIGLYPPGSSRTVVFRRSGIVRVFCNIHPTMSAVIVVLESPYFSVSSRSGEFQIQDVPPGEYRFRLFHERAAEDRLTALERRIAVESDSVAVPPVVISETGYLAAPHKNKYGKDYPPVVDDRVLYPSAQK